MRTWERLLPYLDGAFVSLKGAQELHDAITQTTGTHDLVLQTLAWLSARGKLLEVRLVLVDPFHTEAEVDAMAAIVQRVAPGAAVRVSPYRAHGVKSAVQMQPASAAVLAHARAAFGDAFIDGSVAESAAAA